MLNSNNTIGYSSIQWEVQFLETIQATLVSNELHFINQTEVDSVSVMIERKGTFRPNKIVVLSTNPDRWSHWAKRII